MSALAGGQQAMNSARCGPERLLARADVWWLLRDLVGVDRNLQGEVNPQDLSDLVVAAGLDPQCSQVLGAALHERDAVSPAERAMDLTTWADAATGLDLHEAAYVRRDRGVILGDLAAFYRAFGVDPTTQHDRRPDLLATELEFAGLLSALRARAVGEEPDAEAADVTQAAAAAFWGDHLAAWVVLPAARADFLPAPAWLKRATDAVGQVAAGLAAAEGWPQPTLEDEGTAQETQVGGECAVAPCGPE